MDIKLGDLVYSQGHCGMIITMSYEDEYKGEMLYEIEWYGPVVYADKYKKYPVSKWRRQYLEYRKQLKKHQTVK